METERKVKFALAVVSVLAILLAAHGLHAGTHMSVLERGGRAD